MVLMGGKADLCKFSNQNVDEYFYKSVFNKYMHKYILINGT